MAYRYNEYTFLILRAIVTTGYQQLHTSNDICLHYSQLEIYVRKCLDDDFDKIMFDYNILKAEGEDVISRVEVVEKPTDPLYYDGVGSWKQFQFLPYHDEIFLTDVSIELQLHFTGFTHLTSIITRQKQAIFEFNGVVPTYYDVDIFMNLSAPKLWPKTIDNLLRAAFGESNTNDFERILFNFHATQYNWILLYLRWLDAILNYVYIN